MSYAVEYAAELEAAAKELRARAHLMDEKVREIRRNDTYFAQYRTTEASTQKVLQAMDAFNRWFITSEISKAAGLSDNVARLCLKALASQGLILHNGGTYRGSSWARLDVGKSFRSSRPSVQRIREFFETAPAGWYSIKQIRAVTGLGQDSAYEGTADLVQSGELQKVSQSRWRQYAVPGVPPPMRRAQERGDRKPKIYEGKAPVPLRRIPATDAPPVTAQVLSELQEGPLGPREVMGRVGAPLDTVEAALHRLVALGEVFTVRGTGRGISDERILYALRVKAAA